MSAQPAGSTYEALWPGGPIGVPVVSPAARPPTLHGKKVAFLWDYMFRGEEIFPAIQAGLEAAFETVSVVGYDTFGSVFGGDEEAVLAALPDRLRDLGVDAVVCGMGCWGARTPAVLRASAIAEKAGFPSVSLVCDGFVGQARAVSGGLGVPDLAIARVVGHVDSQDSDELAANLARVTIPEVIARLTSAPAASAAAETYAPDDIVARGSFEEINRIFDEKRWSDGLPVVPPTREKVAAFVACTDDDPARAIGVLQPSGCLVTVQNVAVNGVMANCRPDYMPVLIAIAEVLADPGYGVQHSGDTTGGEALIVLNGPVIGELGFNCAGAALRDGYRANTSTGRFLRLLLRNVARSLPEGADKSTFGNSWRVVLAENEAAVAGLGWPSFAEDQGFAAGESVVTIARYTGGGVVGSIYGRDPRNIVAYLADGLVRQSSWELAFTVGFAPGTYRPLLVLSPLVAQTLSRAGLDKAALKVALFEAARLPARKLESYIGDWSNTVPGRRTLQALVKAGQADPIFAASDDPERLVPIVVRPEDIQIIVSGDPLRSNAYAFGHNGMHGFPTSKPIRRRAAR